jgi:hypothetical protein
MNKIDFKIIKFHKNASAVNNVKKREKIIVIFPKD